MKNHRIANNSTDAVAREKINTDLESFELSNFVDACLTKFENNQILLNKISHRFLLTTKLFSGLKSLIIKTEGEKFSYRNCLVLTLKNH